MNNTHIWIAFLLFLMTRVEVCQCRMRCTTADVRLMLNCSRVFEHWCEWRPSHGHTVLMVQHATGCQSLHRFHLGRSDSCAEEEKKNAWKVGSCWKLQVLPLVSYELQGVCSQPKWLAASQSSKAGLGKRRVGRSSLAFAREGRNAANESDRGRQGMMSVALGAHAKVVQQLADEVNNTRKSRDIWLCPLASICGVADEMKAPVPCVFLSEATNLIEFGL